MINKILAVVLLGCGFALSGASQNYSSVEQAQQAAANVQAAGVAKSAAANAAASSSSSTSASVVDKNGSGQKPCVNFFLNGQSLIQGNPHITIAALKGAASSLNGLTYRDGIRCYFPDDCNIGFNGRSTAQENTDRIVRYVKMFCKCKDCHSEMEKYDDELKKTKEASAFN